jgi:16S rRNA (cytidine1402-2'-O)-methyltransferase
MTEQSTEKESAWLLPARDKGKPRPGLYLVATPIGNLADITLRALDILSAADLVVCEDTRVSGKLLSHYGLHKKLLPYNDHNAAQQRVVVMEALARGEVVALISDAGTPLINDPGFKLVRTAIEQKIYVTTLPGANAPLSALQLSNLPSDQFCFLGFLPNKSAGRQKMLAVWKNAETTLIAFETAPRLLDALSDIKEALGEREVAVVREITKMYEESRRGSVEELIAHYAKTGEPKGEIVLVIGPGQAAAYSDEDVEKELRKALKTMSTKEAAALVATVTGRPRKELYTLALEIAHEKR